MNNLLEDSHAIILKKCILAIKVQVLYFVYNILMNCARSILYGVALFNPKVKKGVLGRKLTFELLDKHITDSDRTLWFHCASLGEYEQGLPVFQALRTHLKDHKIILSFFSPSGYEVRKNSPIADVVIYLPLDTKKNANQFVRMLQPELTVFVKYELWPNFLTALKTKNCKSILISALIRPDRSYFKFYGKILRQSLFSFDHIFVQDESSKELLNRNGYNTVTVSGDTRFDRVYNQLRSDNTLEFIEDFKQDSLCVVAGSTWPEDERLLVDYINKNASSGLKFIVAPHNINHVQVEQFQKLLKVKSLRYTEIEQNKISDSVVLIMDTIGLLSKIYFYADIAYVGGAAGTTGLHNTLEPAVFGIPIIIGHNYSGFPEAIAMKKNKGLFSVKNPEELNTVLDQLLQNDQFRFKTGKFNAHYIEKNKGAVIQIMKFLRI